MHTLTQTLKVSRLKFQRRGRDTLSLLQEKGKDMDAIEDRVKRGAEWLDSVELAWEKRITVTDLDIDCGCYCVVGQVFGSFHATIGLERMEWAKEHGFAVYNDRHNDAFDRECNELENAWTNIIYERRERSVWNTQEISRSTTLTV